MLVNLYYDDGRFVRFASKTPIRNGQYRSVKTDLSENTNLKNLVGKKVMFKKPGEMKVAIITDWDAPCGISTYSKYLVDALTPKVDDIKIFSETNKTVGDANSSYNVDYCWSRGTSMKSAVEKIKEYNPTVILLQHEFGLFPKANHFLKMIEGFEEVPFVTTLHSVYEHLDKSTQSSALKNVIVHSKEAQLCLRDKLGHKSQNSWVINHGCVDFGDIKPAFNSFDSKHPILQFGFAFPYKGIEVTLEAIALLKKRHEKFNDIVYLFLSSENPHNLKVHSKYIAELREKATSLDVADNFIVQRGFLSDQEINQYLRTTRLSVFPYQTDPQNIVRGASGAVRIAMANGNPVICSTSPMFDDLEGILPRPSNAMELANEIAKSFSDGRNRKAMLLKQREYITNNTWDITAQRYLGVLREVVDKANEGVILVGG